MHHFNTADHYTSSGTGEVPYYAEYFVPKKCFLDPSKEYGGIFFCHL